MGFWAGGSGDRLGGKERDERQLNLPQDWAPAHSAKKMLQCCETTLPGFWGGGDLQISRSQSFGFCCIVDSGAKNLRF